MEIHTDFKIAVSGRWCKESRIPQTRVIFTLLSFCGEYSCAETSKATRAIGLKVKQRPAETNHPISCPIKHKGFLAFKGVHRISNMRVFISLSNAVLYAGPGVVFAAQKKLAYSR